MADEVALLTDDELRTQLRHFNLPDGPITGTTRKMFERKLHRALKLDSEIDEHQSIVEDTSSLATLPLELNHVEHAADLADGTADSKLANTFYGVCLQADEENISSPQSPLVFTEKSEALLSVKKNSGARFKAFNNRKEAEAFAFNGKAITPSQQVSPVLVPKPTDPIGNYKAPKPGEIVRFRRLIERGELGQLSELIYKNPKYLISSGDTPVILQEGSRYNALHVAAKAGKKDVCQLIIDTLDSDDFWKLLYPGDENQNMKDQHVNSRRKMFVLDMYLNTPDKGGCDTPLHFACKFGKADVVEYLLSCPAVDKTLPNKYGETPCQVTCNRVPDYPEELRSKIQNMFTKEDTVYVPIMRSDDNCSFPKIGTPWSPGCGGRPEEHHDSPGDPRYRVSAYAGPMSPQEADMFCYTLKSPRATPEKRTKFRNIKRSDSEKGLERVARKLAKSQSVAWCEYWKFLDCFSDLSTKDGLTNLEEYLRAKKETYTNSNAKKGNMLRTPDSDRRLVQSRGVHDTYDFVFEQEDGALDPGYEGRTNCHTPTGRNRNIKGFRNRLQWDELKENEQLGVHEAHDLFGGDKLNCTDPSANLAVPNGETVPEKGFSLRNDECVIEKCLTSIRDVSEEKRQSKNEREELLVNELCTRDELLLHEDKVSSLDVSNSSEESLLGLVSGFEHLHLEDTPSPKEERRVVSGEVNGAFPVVNTRIVTTCRSTPSTGKGIPLFIEGFQPSKVDLDVLRAINSEKFDLDDFPNIYQWKKMVQSFSKSTREAWPGPGSPRYHRNRRVNSLTWSY